MGVLAWSPLGRGVLTGKYRGGIPSDSRAADPHWEAFVGAYLTPSKAGVVEALARAAEGLDVTEAHVALAWLLGRPGVSAADRRRTHDRTAAGKSGVGGARAAARDHSGA